MRERVSALAEERDLNGRVAQIGDDEIPRFASGRARLAAREETIGAALGCAVGCGAAWATREWPGSGAASACHHHGQRHWKDTTRNTFSISFIRFHVLEAGGRGRKKAHGSTHGPCTYEGARNDTNAAEAWLETGCQKNRIDSPRQQTSFDALTQKSRSR